jgi:hypothetical protein
MSGGLVVIKHDPANASVVCATRGVGGEFAPGPVRERIERRSRTPLSPFANTVEFVREQAQFVHEHAQFVREHARTCNLKR